MSRVGSLALAIAVALRTCPPAHRRHHHRRQQTQPHAPPSPPPQPPYPSPRASQGKPPEMESLPHTAPRAEKPAAAGPREPACALVERGARRRRGFRSERSARAAACIQARQGPRRSAGQPDRVRRSRSWPHRRKDSSTQDRASGPPGRTLRGQRRSSAARGGRPPHRVGPAREGEARILARAHRESPRRTRKLGNRAGGRVHGRGAGVACAVGAGGRGSRRDGLNRGVQRGREPARRTLSMIGPVLDDPVA
jgi:hypothetical protein